MYLKFYSDPAQASAEFIANAVYAKLGIKAAISDLISVNGRVAIASKEIPGALPCTPEELAVDSSIRNGFVADVYLANWDVVGLQYDNIVRSSEGSLYRIDNGGSINFRARGEHKDFAAGKIEELDSMREKQYPAGKIFGALTDDDIRLQAKTLVDSISESDIDDIISRSGLSDEAALEIRTALIARRGFLIEKLDLDPQVGKRVEEARRRLNEQGERFPSAEMFPRVALIADSNSIENQEVDITRADTGALHIQFKLTEWHYNAMLTRFREMRASGAAFVRLSDITYGRAGSTFSFAEAYETVVDELTIKLATGERHGNDMRTALGLVEIIIPPTEKYLVSDAEIGQKVDQILRKQLDVSHGLQVPDAQSETEYKHARFKWHHKLSQVPDGIDDKLTREEVCPGYFTFVERGKHKEYLAGRSKLAFNIL